MSTTGNMTESNPGVGGGSPPSSTTTANPTPAKTLKLLQCKFCMIMIANDKTLAIAHFKKCRKRGTQPDKPQRERLTQNSERRHRHQREFEVAQRDHHQKSVTIHPPRINAPSNAKKTTISKSADPHKIMTKLLMANGHAPIYSFANLDSRRLPFDAFRCFLCRQRFGKAGLCNTHKRSDCPGVASPLVKRLPLSCSTLFKSGSSPIVCQRRLRSWIELLHHRLTHNPTFKKVKRRAFKRWRRWLGKWEFKSRWMIPPVDKTTRLKCSHCWRHFLKSSTFRRHILMETVLKLKDSYSLTQENHATRLESLISSYSKGYHCSKCREKFQSSLHLRTHTRKEHPKARNDSDSDSLSDDSLSDDNNYLTCMKCAETGPSAFFNRRSLAIHNRNNHRKVRCRNCSIIFMGVNALNQHRKMVHGTRYYACEYPGCGRTFTFFLYFQSHVKSHENKNKKWSTDHRPGRKQSQETYRWSVLKPLIRDVLMDGDEEEMNYWDGRDPLQ